MFAMIPECPDIAATGSIRPVLPFAIALASVLYTLIISLAILTRV